VRLTTNVHPLSVASEDPATVGSTVIMCDLKTYIHEDGGRREEAAVQGGECRGDCVLLGGFKVAATVYFVMRHLVGAETAKVESVLRRCCWSKH
jgi:hypothetical protein